MKKYLIVNDDGTKKTIYAKALMQALKLGDAINITPGMFITLKVDPQPQRYVYRVKEINHGEYGVVLVRYSINEDGQLVERDAGGNYSLASLKKNVNNIFNTYDEAKKYLLHRDAVRTAYITGLKSLRKKNDSDSSISIIFNKLYNSDYDNFDEVKRDFDRLKSSFSDTEKEKIYKEIAFTFGMTISSVKQRLGDSKQKNDSVHDEAYNPEYSIQQFKSYVSNIMKDLYGNEYNRETVRAISKLDAYVSQVIDDFKADIKNSNLDKRKTVQYYTQYVDALYKELTDVKNVQNIDGQSLKKIDDIHAEMARSIHDSIKDSKIADIEPISHYIEAWRICNLAADLLYEAQKYGYSFDDVLKKYDAMTSKILALVKNKINEERNNMINWKQNHPDKLN